MNYTTKLIKEKDGDYSVSFPDLDGCFTQGDTLEEALANAKEAMELTLEDVFDGEPERQDAEAYRRKHAPSYR